MPPLISVVLDNYNYGHLIRQAIDSVLGQTCADFELIVVDDGSSDHSREIIAEYQDPRIQTVFQDNQGQAAAFNAGFRLARGDLIAFLDSDDWWKPEKLATVARWHAFLAGDYALLQHAMDVWLEGELQPYKHILPVGDCFQEMQATSLMDFFVPTSGLVFPRQILAKIMPMPIQFRIAADAYLMRTAFVFGQVYSIPESLGYYRQHRNSVFQNASFDQRHFLYETLIPALNAFYREQGLDYQLRLAPPNSLKTKLYRLWKQIW